MVKNSATMENLCDRVHRANFAVHDAGRLAGLHRRHFAHWPHYNFRNVLVRWRATLATILGIALVVAVFVLVQSLAVGLEKSASNTGDPRNIMIVRKGSTAESSSRFRSRNFKSSATGRKSRVTKPARRSISADLLCLISQPRIDGQGEANVSVRGLKLAGLALRPQVKLVAGRWFTPGKREVAVSRKMAAALCPVSISAIRFAPAATRSRSSANLTAATARSIPKCGWTPTKRARFLTAKVIPACSCVRRVRRPGKEIISRIEADKRLPLLAGPEMKYYAEQTMTAMPIKILGNFLATAMSIGAMFAAMNTMYASVGSRTREIGTLRVLGFRRRTILASFIIEGALLAAIGGVLGCLLALPLHGVSTGTMSFNSFSETVFEFRITPWLAAKGMIFAVVVGVIGSLLPAIRASRLPVITALKSV